MATPQVCERRRGGMKCSNHPKDDIILKCEQCGIFVCKHCVPSGHQGHTFSKLSTSFKQSKDNLQTHMWKLKKKILPSIREEISSFKKDLDEKKTFYKDEVKLANEIRQKYIADINSIFSSYISLIDEQSTESQEPVEMHVTELQNLESEVLAQIDWCKSVLKGTDIEIHDDENEVKGQPEIEIPQYTPTTTLINQPYLSSEKVESLIAQALSIVEEIKYLTYYDSFGAVENSDEVEYPEYEEILLHEV